MGISRVTELLIPTSQRLSAQELHDSLDLGAGDVGRKRSAFLIMLVLSGVIAITGVLADSTATVIGAMIIAPLATPILGIGLGIVVGQLRLVLTSLAWVMIGLAIVVFIGAISARFVADPTTLAVNSQVTGRTSPGLLDLAAALATGTAGAFAIARRDLSAVLPGVAIAISLVPPLAVVGVCAGVGAWDSALGALWLFLSNVVALIIASSIVLTIAGYAKDPASLPTAKRRRAYTVVGVAAAVVIIPLALNTAVSVAIASWGLTIRDTTQTWIGDGTDVRMTGLSWVGVNATVDLVSDDGQIPSTDELTDALETLPEFVSVDLRVQNEALYPVR
ncbi:DUF389 domain-containing protein [Microbacterium sediminicola]|uniref:DUF389 domain-containing protein n=1 Tax=Microbacterium sediminicola TaxID=415210 RepID=A0ABP4U8W1_9MICO